MDCTHGFPFKGGRGCSFFVLAYWEYIGSVVFIACQENRDHLGAKCEGKSILKVYSK